MGNLPATERNPFSCGYVIGWFHSNTLSNIGDFCLRIVLASITSEDVQLFQRGFSHRIWSFNLKIQPKLFDTRLVYHPLIKYVISYSNTLITARKVSFLLHHLLQAINRVSSLIRSIL